MPPAKCSARRRTRCSGRRRTLSNVGRRSLPGRATKTLATYMSCLSITSPTPPTSMLQAHAYQFVQNINERLFPSGQNTRNQPTFKSGVWGHPTKTEFRFRSRERFFRSTWYTAIDQYNLLLAITHMFQNETDALYTISHGIPYRVQRLQQTSLSGNIYTLKYIVYLCILLFTYRGTHRLANCANT